MRLRALALLPTFAFAGCRSRPNGSAKSNNPDGLHMDRASIIAAFSRLSPAPGLLQNNKHIT